MANTLKQTVKDNNNSRGMRIENLPSLADTYPIKEYPNILKSWNIDGAVENIKKYVTDIVYMICFLFLV